MDMGSLLGHKFGTELQERLLRPPSICGTLGKASIDSGFNANEHVFWSRVLA